jgi:hypothetical protein
VDLGRQRKRKKIFDKGILERDWLRYADENGYSSFTRELEETPAQTSGVVPFGVTPKNRKDAKKVCP